METELVGTLARLPDGQLVEIRAVEESTAQVKRIDGERAGTLAVCLVAKLETVNSKRFELAAGYTRSA